jgi:hypothetical protein
LLAAAIAADLIAWLQIHALDGDLAKAEPNGCATACCTPPPASPRAPPPLATHRRHLALGRPDHRRVRSDRGDPRTRLSRLSPRPTDQRTQATTPTAATDGPSPRPAHILIDKHPPEQPGRPGRPNTRIIEASSTEPAATGPRERSHLHSNQQRLTAQSPLLHGCHLDHPSQHRPSDA